MQTTQKFDATHFIRSCYDATLMFSYVACLVLIVALGAYGLEMLSSAL